MDYIQPESLQTISLLPIWVSVGSSYSSQSLDKFDRDAPSFHMIDYMHSNP